MKPLLPMPNITTFERVIAIDIETSSQGELLDIGVWDGTSESGHFYFWCRSWEEFFIYLMQVETDCRVIAHNGFGFDFITFNQWFLDNRKKYGIADEDVIYLSSESLLVAMIIRKSGIQYTLLDTMRFFPGQSLQKLAESFLGESKDDVPEDFISRMEDYKVIHRQSYYAYLKKDCEILYNVYAIFRQQINDFQDIGELGMSAGSTALKTFRRWLFKNHPDEKIFSAPSEYQDFANHCLRGGLTLYVGDGTHKNHLYESVNHYDVVSMYPSVMRFVPVPTAPMVYTDKLVTDGLRIRPGWYLADFEQTKGRVPILYGITGDMPIWKGQGIFCHFELQFLQRYGVFQIHDGVCYTDYCFPFETYFDELLALRLQAKHEKLSAKAHALKILANALYGKFGQKATREIIAITSDRDWYESYLHAQLLDFADSGITEYAVSDDYVIYGVESQSTAFSNRFVGAMVTALARLKLGLLLNAYPAIYCDTDSIFTQHQLDSCFIGNQPGDFEKSDKSPASMICLGKKSYLYADDIKFKGVPPKNLTLDDIDMMRFEMDVVVDYRSPTAWRTAMSKRIENPNKFLPRQRRVKRGKSLAEIGLLRTDREFFGVSETKTFLDSLLTT